MAHDAFSSDPKSEPQPSDTPTVVTLVHGTFARGTNWTQAGSTLRNALSRALAGQTDLSSSEIVFDTFEWSGRNTHRARIRAGYELADHVRALRTRYPDCRHFIVAHSHGGNIALLAHQHLANEAHALGIATLGTPFVFARLESHLQGKSLDDLRAEAPRHTETIAGVLAWGVGLLVALTSEAWLTPLGFTEFYWEIGSGVAAGLLTALVMQLIYPPVARFFHRFGARLAAAKLAGALQFPELPRTHLLSLTYPGDEAQRLLDALEATTSLPQRAIRLINAISEPGFGVLMGALIGVAALSAVAETFIDFDDRAFGDMVGNIFASIITFVIIAWIVLVSVRFVLSFLRGHPWGFGWERPSLHAHVSIGVEPKAEVPMALSHTHELVPYSETAVPSGGLRHVGLYEDPRILKALADWMRSAVR